MTEAYPLCWPEGWKRTPHLDRSVPRFKTTFDVTRAGLMRELARLGARDVVLSTNVPLRRDGAPYASIRREAQYDPGVAVYFRRGKRQLVIACDKWTDVTNNVHALRLTIEAIRGIERWGTSALMERAFVGFQALPPASEPEPPPPWWKVLEVDESASIEECRAARRRLAMIWHPDIGTAPDSVRMGEINAALQEREELK